MTKSLRRITWFLTPTLAFTCLVPQGWGAPAPSLPPEPISPPPTVQPVAPALPPQPAAAPTANSLLAEQHDTVLAPGVTLSSFTRLYPSGWVEGHLVRIDLTRTEANVDLVTAPAVTAADPLSVIAQRSGALAAINGDFFDIGNTKMPLGPQVQGGELTKTGPEGWSAMGIGKDRIGRLLEVSMKGTVNTPKGQLPLSVVNQYTVPEQSIGVYTPLWTVPRKGAAFGAALVRQVVLRAGRVVAIADTLDDQPVPSDGLILVGREAGASSLAGLKVGDAVSVTYQPYNETVKELRFAIGGGKTLVKDGAVLPLDDRRADPRTAAGFSADGKEMFLLAVDGRSEASGGLTLRQLGELLQGLGAANALELDGGGSTTMVARLPGQAGPELVNQPSDGVERRVPNGIGVFAKPGSGKLVQVKVEPTVGTDLGTRLFPGLTRQLAAKGQDEQFGPAPLGEVTWQATAGVEVDANGLVRGMKPGTATVTAQERPKKPNEELPKEPAKEPATQVPEKPAEETPKLAGERALRVLGPLQRIETDQSGLRLGTRGEGSFAVYGYDAEGYIAPIEPADLKLEYDQSLLRIEPAEGGRLQVTSLKEGSAIITITVQGKVAKLAVAAGSTRIKAADFETLNGWTFTKFPATVGGSLTSVAGQTGKGLKLLYRFDTMGATRAAYIEANPALPLPGTPERIGLMVKGDGKGAWLRAVVIDAKGEHHTLNLARNVDWTDWRQVEATLPPGIAYPVKLHRIYPVETGKDVAYSGELIFDDLTALEPVDLPFLLPQPGQTDPILQGGKPASLNASRVALVAGMGIPSTTDLQARVQARLKLATALAGRPASLLILGESGTAPTAEQRTSLESFTTLELRGQASHRFLANDRRTADLNGTRFIWVDTGADGLRAAYFSQWFDVKQGLDQAAADPAVKRVVLVGQRAPHRLPDQREGEVLERWLTQFREQSGGKPAAFVALGAEQNAVRRVEGVPYLELKQAEAPILTIDPDAPADGAWLNPTP